MNNYSNNGRCSRNCRNDEISNREVSRYVLFFSLTLQIIYIMRNMLTSRKFRC
uniref:Big defensin n=1 Tax=Myoviridae sp. ctk6V34 TaxID=2825164 RepID=A0A8S5V3X4_9CAUD|nr:MAG TPA: Big defensin [Myoviridae sp. ctk6V34]